MVPPEFGETFAPVARWVSIRIILAIATHFNLFSAGDDVETAFLLAEMDTEMYVTPPPGYKHLFPPPHEPHKGETRLPPAEKYPGIRQGSRLFWQKLLQDLASIG